MNLPRPLLSLLLALPLLAQAPPAAGMVEASYLALPIRVDLNPLLVQMEAQVPLSPPKIETWAEIKGKPRAYFRFNLIREPLLVRMKDAQVSLLVTANYGMDVGVRTLGQHYTVVGSCGRSPEAPRRVLLELRTTLGLRPDWGVELSQTAFEVRPLSTCEITFLGFDITSQVAAGMHENLAEGTATLARLVRESALARQKAQEAWTLLSQPIELGRDLYLLFQPRRIRLAPLATQGRVLVITPEIETQPRLVMGAKPLVPAAALPALEPNASPRSGFRLKVEADLSYAHASRQLAAELVGRTFDTDRGRFGITSVRVWGDQGRAFMDVGLEGRVTGKVTLSGRPVRDPLTHDLRFEDLDFTLESRSWLTRMGDWIYHSSLRKVLTEKAHFLLDQQFQGLRESVQAGLNRSLAPNLRLSGQLRELRMGEVGTGPEGFLSSAYLEGEVQLELK
ncbi:MAG: DUF4403 family protein [Geothrix sp.]